MQTDHGLVFPAAVSAFVAVPLHENALGIANIQQSVPECSLSMMRPPFHAECRTGECSTLMAHKHSFHFVLTSLMSVSVGSQQRSKNVRLCEASFTSDFHIVVWFLCNQSHAHIVLMEHH